MLLLYPFGFRPTESCTILMFNCITSNYGTMFARWLGSREMVVIDNEGGGGGVGGERETATQSIICLFAKADESTGCISAM